MTVRCLLFYAAWFGLEVSTSDVRVAFMHAVASEPKFAKLQSSNAQPDMADQESNERNEHSVERFRWPGCRRDEKNAIRARKKQTHRSTKTPNPKHQSYSTLTITSADISSVDTHRGTHVVESTRSDDT